MTEQKLKIYVDEFEKLIFVDADERNKRTLWVRCNISISGAVFMANVYQPFKNHLDKTGLVRNITVKIGHKIKGKVAPHNYLFIEFEDEKSAKKCLRLI